MKKILCKVLSITIFVMINIFVVFNSFAINANEQSDLYQEISRNDVVVMNDVSWTNIIANTINILYHLFIAFLSLDNI